MLKVPLFRKAIRTADGYTDSRFQNDVGVLENLMEKWNISKMYSDVVRNL
jgi:hypothetical protein